MSINDIKYPSKDFQDYVNVIYDSCQKNNLSMLLKGSLAKGTATRFSDIDLVILGDITEKIQNDIILTYGNPIMTNYTENPKGILILVYDNTISVDLDIRKTITQKELSENIVLIQQDMDFNISDEIIRHNIITNFIPERPTWYKILRLVHRATIKYLSHKENVAFDLLMEIKDNMESIELYNIEYHNNIKEDLQTIFTEIVSKFDVNKRIIDLFTLLFNKL